MKFSFLFILLCISLFSFAQQNKSKPLLTEQYTGVYSFGKNVEKEPGGMVTVFAETDSTVLFYIDVCRGAPSYNLGQHYDRLKIKNGKGIFTLEKDFGENGCKWEVTIVGKTLTISTIDACFDCGFGANVVADNKYFRKGQN